MQKEKSRGEQDYLDIETKTPIKPSLNLTHPVWPGKFLLKLELSPTFHAFEEASIQTTPYVVRAKHNLVLMAESTGTKKAKFPRVLLNCHLQQRGFSFGNLFKDF